MATIRATGTDEALRKHAQIAVCEDVHTMSADPVSPGTFPAQSQ
jgi:hypothetical protein